MNRSLGIAVVAFGGGFLVALALTWAAGLASGSDDRREFCSYVEQWHGLAIQLEGAVSTVNRATSSGWRELEENYRNVALVVIPVPTDAEATALAGMIADWNAAAERFIVRNHLHAVVSAQQSPASNAERVEAFKEMEDSRLHANDLLRRINPHLDRTCSLGPVDPYT